MPNHSTHTQFSSLVRQNSHLFPTDPFVAHTAPPGRTAEEVTAEKKTLHHVMIEAANEFEGTSRALIQATADLVILLHHNQFRKGPGQAFYGSHVEQVGKRAGDATLSYKGSFPIIKDHFGEQIPPKAFTIALGRLHDTIEDFWENFSDGTVSRSEGGEIAAAKILIELSRVIGPAATDELLARVRGLSLENSDEFPDRVYVDRILEDPFMRCCKGADYDHNLETFPSFTEGYPLFIVPAQYGTIVEGTLFEESYAQKLLVCLNTYDENEVVPWNKTLREVGVKTSDMIKDLFDKYNEPEALDRLQAYYERLSARLNSGDFDELIATQVLDKKHLQQRIQALFGELESILPPYLRVTPEEEIGATTPEVSTNFVVNTPVQLLGPMRAWGGQILIAEMSLDDAKALVEKTGQSLGCRFPGYFSEADDGPIVYHISRYPRRAGLEVPPLSEFRTTLQSLYDAFTESAAQVEMREEELTATPTIRVVLGLREGYFDQRKEDIEAKIEDGTFSDIEEVRLAISHRLGDLSEHGIDVDAFDDPQELRKALQQISLSILHDVGEASALLGTFAKVTPAEIYSVAPDYTYSEEAVLIEVPADRGHFEKLVRLADSMKQARFTTERLDTGSVVNVEIKAFTEDRSAQMI